MVGYESNAGVATITIDDPGRRNPMSTVTMVALRDAAARAIADQDVGVLIFTGAGDQAFSAGGDLTGEFVDDPIGLHHQRGALADLFRLIRRGGKPTVARVNGHALAGGFGLAVACDITICVENAKLGVTEVAVGLWPMMISAVLADVMPRKAVLELMMTGRIIDADEAFRLGAVTRIVASDRLDDAVGETCAALLARSPATLMIGRDAYMGILDMGFDAALDRLQAGLTAISSTADAAEGVAAFIAKRPPIWSNL